MISQNTDFSIQMGKMFDFRLSKGDQKKLEIIQATIECIAEFGVEKNSFESIAKKIGTRRSHITYYYQDKDAIYLDVFKYIAGTYQEFLAKYLTHNLRSKNKLDKYLDAYFDWANNNQSQLNAILLLYHFCFYKPEFRAVNQKIREGGIERIAFILKEQYAINSKKAKQLAKGIQAIMSHAVVDSYTFTKSDARPQKRQREARRLIHQLVDAF